jgi:hypothetical protein
MEMVDVPLTLKMPPGGVWFAARMGATLSSDARMLSIYSLTFGVPFSSTERGKLPQSSGRKKK